MKLAKLLLNTLVYAWFFWMVFLWYFMRPDDEAPLYSIVGQWSLFLIVAGLVGLYCVFKPLFNKVNSTKDWVRALQLCGLVLLFCISLLIVVVSGFWLRA